MNDANGIMTNWLHDIDGRLEKLDTKINRITYVVIAAALFVFSINPDTIRYLLAVLHMIGI